MVPGFRQRITKRLDDLLWRRDFDSAEFVMGIIAMIWGLWLLNPAWDSYVSTPSYAPLETLAPEWIVGVGMFMVGAAQIVALLLEARSWRRATALMMVSAWVFIGVTFGYANIASTEGPVCLTYALAEIWAFLRLNRATTTTP